MFLADAYEPAATSVALTVAVSAFVLVALGWMAQAASRQPLRPELDPDLDHELGDHAWRPVARPHRGSPMGGR
jgi:hypothetical protein